MKPFDHHAHTARDPLYDSLVHGDEACPDGHSLARLGRISRQAATPPQQPDLRARVLAAALAEAEQDGDETILDDQLAGDGAAEAADPQLLALRERIRDAARPPQPVDLAPSVVASAHRHSSQRLRASERPSRWRTWTLVAAGHVAALLMLGLLADFEPARSTNAVDITPATALNGGASFYRASLDGWSATQGDQLPSRLPRRWTGAHRENIDLLSLRHSDQRRSSMRRHYGTNGSARTTAAAIDWILAQQLPVGAFSSHGDSSDGGSSDGGSLDERPLALGAHAMALLAVLGEGTEDPRRRDAALRGALWLAGQDTAHLHGSDGLRARGYMALALVDAAQSLPAADGHLRARADTLLRTAPSLPVDADAGIQAPWLLACAQADAAGWAIDAATRSWVHRTLATPMPAAHAPVGRQGLASFARLIAGRGETGDSRQLLDRLSQRLQHPETVDPIAWWLPTLALREGGGQAWLDWADQLQRSLVLAMEGGEHGLHLPADRARNCHDSDLIATAAAVLNLQAAYRYLPLAW